MKRKYRRLRYEDRQTIEQMLREGSGIRMIALRLGTSQATIYNEINRCGATAATYTADAAIQTMKEPAEAGIETDFLFERDGKKGLWLEVL